MRITSLDHSTAPGFRHMTFPVYQRLLAFDPALPATVAIGASNESQPVGLALGAIDPQRSAAELVSLYVEPDYRGRGYATALLEGFECALAHRRVQEVAATYMTGTPSISALERVLRKRGWQDPQPRMLVVRCSLESISRAPWIKRYPLPAGWEVKSWVAVTQGQREAIRATQQAAPWIPEDLVPFQYEAHLEPVTSLALCVEGKVVGWTINHVVSDILRYTCSFVRRDLQRMGRVLLLYNEAVARMPSIGLSIGMWTVPLEHRAMARFAERWMRPYSIFFGETRGTGKVLAVASQGLAHAH